MLINNLQDLFNDNNPNIITNYLELQNIIKATEPGFSAGHYCVLSFICLSAA